MTLLANGPTLTVNRAVDSVAKQTTSFPSSSKLDAAGQTDAVNREVEGAAFAVKQGEDIVSFAALEPGDTIATLARAGQAQQVSATQQAEVDRTEAAAENREDLEQAIEHTQDEAQEKLQEQERLQRITEELNEKLNESLRLRFERDQETGVDVFKLIERDTGDVVRQVPSEEVLEFMRKFRSFSGLLFSEQA